MKAFNCIILGMTLLFSACDGNAQAKQNDNQVPEGEPVTYSVTHSDLWLSKGDQKIYGVLYRPEGLEKAPVVIISHGYGGTHAFGIPYAKALSPLGYAVYAYDFCGGGNNSRSDGKTSDMSLCSERADLAAVIAGLRSLDYIDEDHVILIGESQGGMISALSAADHKDLIDKLVLIYPALCIQDDWFKTYPKGSDVPETFDFWGVTLGRGFIECLYDLDVFGTLEKYEGPVRIFHGDKDATVPLSYSERAQKAYKNASLTVLPGEGHGFSPNGQAQVIEAVKAFLTED